MQPSCLSELTLHLSCFFTFELVLPLRYSRYFPATFGILATVGVNARYGNCIMDLELSCLAALSYRRLSPSSVWQIPSVWRRLC